MENDQPPDGNAGAVSPQDPAALRAGQNLPVALIAGVAAAIIGAIVWAAVSFETGYQIGYLAIAVGFIVGFAVRLGKGVDKIFGLVGGVLALFGCLLGNFLSIILFVCKQQHLNVLNTLTTLNYAKVPAIMAEAFSPMDLVFYAIAVYEGYRFSFHRPSPVGQKTPKR